MSRWTDTVTLISTPEPYQDAGGAWHAGAEERTEVFCDVYTMSLSSRSAAVDMGLDAAAQVKVHAADYDGQQRCIWKGSEMEVVSVSDSGDFAVLTLGRRIGNG